MQVSANGGSSVPISNNDSNSPGGTSIAILFHKPLEPIKASEIKKMLAPVMDFEKHSVTEIYSETLPPETQKAIKEKRAMEGMNHEQVVHGDGAARAQIARDEGRPRDSKIGFTARRPARSPS